MLYRPDIQQMPEKISALHIAGHALRAVAYGVGAWQIAGFGLGDLSHSFSEVHQNIAQGSLHVLGDTALIGSGLYLAKGSGLNLLGVAAESYYNISGMGKRQTRRASGRSPRQWV